ncbi:MAG: DUF3365 domain-containing protein, partial [Desulfobacterales bacterium]|nr:DUF3365 domain-containing protein [Desulfobacterales bacterium]
AAFETDVLYRRWNAGHGGVYAPITATTSSNPYLKIPERDIETPLGLKLTKINPAYMTRQVHEIAKSTTGVQRHITSLKPIRPKNAPDGWEAGALKDFEKGIKEVSSIEVLGGKSYMRLMRPLVTEKGCLRCHAEQGYKTGDIRGGISVSVPLSLFFAIEKEVIFSFFIINGLIWLFGIAGIWSGKHFLKRQILRRLQAEAELRQHEKLQGVMEMAGAVCHELNQPMQAISGYAEILMMELDNKSISLNKRLESIKQQIDRMGAITRKLMAITRYETTEYNQGKIIDIDKAAR